MYLRHVVVFALLGCVSGQDSGCPNLAGAVAGSIFGTLAFVGIILGIVALVYYKRKKKDTEKLKKAQLDVGHENPTFTGDAEKGASGQPISSLSSQAKLEGGFTGYVECKEYESPTKKKCTLPGSQNGSGPVRSLFLEETIMEAANKGQVVRKSGSSGSLDNSYPAMEPNMVVVPLLSQDIMGLGFNVDGNLKEGIFVSKIHKRGPAHEAGLISLGDRILSVTVSFENMVLEDAMTILSYASPYPVKLCLRKPTTTTALVEAPSVEMSPSVVEDKENINHPVYRSQSLDDLRQIGKEGLLHPRRTWSEMKKTGYIPNKGIIEETNLKKWRGQPDIVQEDSSEAGDLNTHSTTSNMSIPDMKIDMGDLRLGPDDFTGNAEVHNDGDRISVSSKEDVSGGVKVLSKSDFNMSADSLNLEQDGIRKEIVTSVNAMPGLQEDGQVGEAAVTMGTTSVSFSGVPDDSNKRSHDPDEEDAESKKIKTEGADDGSVTQDDIDLNLGEALTGPPPMEKPPSLPDAENSDESGQNGSDKVDGEEPTVRDVIRDYFGDNPNILQQFGLPKDAEVSRTVDVTTDGSTMTHTERLETENGIRATTTVESHSEIVTGSPDSGFMGTRPSLEISGVELKHSSSSSSSSASSRSTSPTRRDDEGVEIEVTQATQSKRSPTINKKSTGGLSFDISDQNDTDPNTTKEKATEGSRGVAYYFSIDDHGSPAHSVRPLGSKNYSREELGQPDLIRPNPQHVISTTSVSNYDSDPSSTRTIVTHTERSASSDTAHTKDVNDNSQDLSDIKKGKLTLSSSTEDGFVLKDNSSSHFDKESVTIIKQTDVVEAYTVTVNPEDSLA